jgi:Zn-dependent protease
MFFIYGTAINIILGFFNVLPIPPLDGSQVVASLLPGPLAASYMKIRRVGFLIIMLLFYTNTLDPLFDGAFAFAIRLLGL